MEAVQLSPHGDILIRELREGDLADADRIMRLAFGTFLGMPEPEKFMGDADYVRTRWLIDKGAAFAGELNGEVVGSNFATNWGSVGFFGPLTVRPDLWGRGIAKQLMQPVLDRFEAWHTTFAGLFTFAHSQKHVGLYQSFGFWPRFLTAIMAKSVNKLAADEMVSLYSHVPDSQKDDCLAACREMTDGVFPGLNLQNEIRAIARHSFGDTVLVWDDSKVAAIAVCHFGAGTEAGSGNYYVKFAAARSGTEGDVLFARLFEACERHAATIGASTIIAGVNTGRHEAYRLMLRNGFRTVTQGVAMQRGNEGGYNRPGVYIADDWR